MQQTFYKKDFTNYKVRLFFGKFIAHIIDT